MQLDSLMCLLEPVSSFFDDVLQSPLQSPPVWAKSALHPKDRSDEYQNPKLRMGKKHYEIAENISMHPNLI